MASPGLIRIHRWVALSLGAFIALVGGLFVVSGGILVDIRGRGTPVANVTLLALGVTSPVAFVFVLATAPVALVLACGGAWVGMGRR